MPYRRFSPFALALALPFAAALTASSAAAELPAGEEIARLINARDDGQSVTRDLRMELIDRRGKTRVRETFGVRKYFGEEKRSVVFYRSPTSVKDTAFLTYDYPEAERDDDQWLYLPALRKVRRISAADRGDYFLGTDFSYEDIKKETKVALEDYHWQTLGEEEVDGQRLLLVEAVPIEDDTAEELGYGRVRHWVDPEIWMSRRSVFWDVRGNELKTLEVSDIRQVQDIWTSHRLEVQHHNGHKTIFTFSNVDYSAAVDDRMFTEQAIKRGL